MISIIGIPTIPSANEWEKIPLFKNIKDMEKTIEDITPITIRYLPHNFCAISHFFEFCLIFLS